MMIKNIAALTWASPGLNHLLEIFLEVDNIGKLKGGRNDNNNYDDNDDRFTIFFQLNFYHLACQGLLIIRFPLIKALFHFTLTARALTKTCHQDKQWSSDLRLKNQKFSSFELVLPPQNSKSSNRWKQFPSYWQLFTLHFQVIYPGAWPAIVGIAFNGKSLCSFSFLGMRTTMEMTN